MAAGNNGNLMKFFITLQKIPSPAKEDVCCDDLLMLQDPDHG